jgi:hypothetical protein
MRESLRFPESEWNTLQDRMESGGVENVRNFIEALRDSERIAELYEYAQHAFLTHQWAGKSIDLYAEVVRCGIAWHLHCAREADGDSHPLTARKHKDQAFLLSCRLAHDLCDLWTNDSLPRSRRHFKLGRAAAKDCLRWMEGHEVSAVTEARVWWIRGLHELSLALHIEARRSFATAKDLLRCAFGDMDVPPSHQAAWWLIFCEAFIALADFGAGAMSGLKRAEALAQSLRITSLGKSFEWPEDWSQERAFIALSMAMEKSSA